MAKREFFSYGEHGADIKWRLTHYVVQPLILRNNAWKRDGKAIKADSFSSATTIAEGRIWRKY